MALSKSPTVPQSGPRRLLFATQDIDQPGTEPAGRPLRPLEEFLNL